MAVIEKGVAKLKRAVVGQFAGEGPPIQVIRSVVNWLWGYEGSVEVSQMDVGCYLFEFASESLCEWVLQRSWHIHKAPMVIRRWFPGIQPLDFSKELTPAWIELRDVPAEVITPEGISWLATQLGKPMNKFVRIGFTVKVCVLRKSDAIEVSELKLDMGDDDPAVVRVIFPVQRTYRSNNMPVKRWNARQKSEAAGASSSGNVPESLLRRRVHLRLVLVCLSEGGRAMILSLLMERRNHQTNRRTLNRLRRWK
ncbi:hypothetical protein LINPERPRIM_LOCUS6845 [Linum perenne]